MRYSGSRSDLEAIDAVRREHVRSVNAQDADRALEDFTDDIAYLGPDQPPIIGKTALEAVIRPSYAQFMPHIQMTPRNVTLAGDWAFEWGILSGVIRPRIGGPSIAVHGKYSYVYARQEDGSWRIAVDIYNWNAPVALLD